MKGESWRKLYPPEVLEACDEIHAKYAALSVPCAKCPECGKRVSGVHWCSRFGAFTNASDVCLSVIEGEFNEHNAVLDEWIRHRRLPARKHEQLTLF